MMRGIVTVLAFVACFCLADTRLAQTRDLSDEKHAALSAMTDAQLTEQIVSDITLGFPESTALAMMILFDRGAVDPLPFYEEKVRGSLKVIYKEVVEFPIGETEEYIDSVKAFFEAASIFGHDSVDEKVVEIVREDAVLTKVFLDEFEKKTDPDERFKFMFSYFIMMFEESSR